ncbi:hypothetical protein vBPaePP1G_059 [Pseudomonas phage vB_PaeP_P1G]|uniref:Uncharacterized protein n=1 Tax=Pseudomonas phage vB_PaeP_P1G TaxID=3025372 RepID=A0AAE9YAB3_9CAUD|nr:hypothetical protein vBPaePP1G_059 [Pseudomonas phage vB_PaeP_P1G]
MCGLGWLVWAGVVTPGLILVSSCENPPDSDTPTLPP